MSQARKVLQPSKRLTELAVPPRFARGVGTTTRKTVQPDGTVETGGMVRGANEAEVKKSADSLALRMGGAVEAWRKAKTAGKGVNAAIKPLDDMAELVRRADIERKDPDGGAVVANVASALLQLPPDDRMIVLRRAGRPAFFEPLVEGDLPEPPGGLQPKQSKAAQRKALAEAESDRMQRSDLPLAQRPSSFFVEPQRYTAEGVKGDPAKSYKGHVPKDNQDVAVRQGGAKEIKRGGTGGLTQEDIEFWGMKEAEPSTRKQAANALAGDQIAQSKAIDKTFGAEDSAVLPQVVTRATSSRSALRKLVKEEVGKLPKGVQLTSLYTALRPMPDMSNEKVAAARQWVNGLPPEQQRRLFDAAAPAPPPPPEKALSVGASQQPQGRWTGKASALEIEKEVARRQRSTFQKHLEPLYANTAPLKVNPAREVSVTEADEVGLSRSTIDPNAKIDLDQMFPWWRARFAVLDAKGRYRYPARLPSAEWIAGMIQGMYGVDDPDFVQRMAPLIQRSIDAAPDMPDPRRIIKDAQTGKMRPFNSITDAGMEGEAVTTSRAGKYLNKVLLLSPSMEQAMRAGVGSRDYPYAVYGDRKVPLPAVTKPERYLTGGEPKKKGASAEDGIRKLKGKKAGGKPDAQSDVMERMKKYGPGTNEVSSIYTLPPNSPMRALLA
jgi:hypothetical protein